MLWRLLVRMLRELSRAGHRFAGFLEGVGSALEKRWSEDKIPRALRERYPDAPDHWLEDIAAHFNLDALQDSGPMPDAAAAQPSAPRVSQATQAGRRSRPAIARPDMSEKAIPRSDTKSPANARQEPSRAPRPLIVVESARRSSAPHVAAEPFPEESRTAASLHLGDDVRSRLAPAATFSAAERMREVPAPANQAQINAPAVTSNSRLEAAPSRRHPQIDLSFVQSAASGKQRMSLRGILRHVLTAFPAHVVARKHEEIALSTVADTAPPLRPRLWPERRHAVGRSIVFRSHISARTAAVANERRMLDPDDRWPALPPHDEGLVSAPIERTRLDRLRTEQEQGSWSA